MNRSIYVRSVAAPQERGISYRVAALISPGSDVDKTASGILVQKREIQSIAFEGAVGKMTLEGAQRGSAVL